MRSFLRTRARRFELEVGAAEEVFDPAVAEERSQERPVPDGLEVLEDVNVADVEEIDESDGPHLQQKGEAEQQMHAIHPDLLLDVEHAVDAVDGAKDALYIRRERKIATSNITVSGSRLKIDSTGSKR